MKFMGRRLRTLESLRSQNDVSNQSFVLSLQKLSDGGSVLVAGCAEIADRDMLGDNFQPTNAYCSHLTSSSPGFQVKSAGE